MRLQAVAGLASGVVVCGLVGAVAWTVVDATPATAGVGVRLHAPSLMAAGGDAGRDEAPAVVAPGAESQDEAADRTARALFTHGSLQGTTLPPWGVARDADLLPQRALRDRFDHYLLGMGDVTLAALRALVQRDARRDLGDTTASAVMDLWDRYLQLLQHPFEHVGRAGDLDSIAVALQERVHVRQAVLGLHWARAFYADEEQALAADVAREARQAAPPRDDDAPLLNPAAGTDPRALHRQRVARYGAERAARLQAIDDEQAVWEARVAAARSAGRRVQGDAALSAPQRAEALAALLATQFPQADERLRAGALLGW